MGIRYEVLYDTSTTDLSNNVSDHLEAGWTLVGGLVLGKDSRDCNRYFQAILWNRPNEPIPNQTEVASTSSQYDE